ncbi:radical SAM protein, partial [Virgibacillus salexigens]|uniref:radical SAM protein n=1 Tax=Virgibacillus salexigens TaxID=61016 RepID=UPI003F69317C
MNAIQSVYIHVPFCQQICHYCAFTNFFYNEKLADDYIEALKHEINAYVTENGNDVKTICIGGGTPTALTVSQLDALLSFIKQKFDISRCGEFSIEANPGDFTEDKV